MVSGVPATSRRQASAIPGRARGFVQAAEDLESGGVLLTGATGFVGMELLTRYLERTDRRVYALVRGADDHEVAARMRRTLLSLFGADHPYTERVVAVRGDITRPGLGLRGERDRLAERVSEIVHGAASVSFELGLEASRAINVEGTRRVLDFAERCRARGGLRRFSYISTAYVAGEHSGCFSEDDLDVGQRFRNAYEQSKFEAETLVARKRPRLPITVLRPSIIVGERDSGWTASFNVLYWPLRAFARGAYPALPARAHAPVDVVPVDYVADAIFALSQAPEAEGATFHLTAGAQTTSVGELVELATTRFQRPSPRLIDALAVPTRGAPAACSRKPRRALSPGADTQRGLLPVLLDGGRLRRSSLPRSASGRGHQATVAACDISTGSSSSRSPPSGDGGRYRAPRRGQARRRPLPGGRRAPFQPKPEWRCDG